MQLMKNRMSGRRADDLPMKDSQRSISEEERRGVKKKNDKRGRSFYKRKYLGVGD